MIFNGTSFLCLNPQRGAGSEAELVAVALVGTKTPSKYLEHKQLCVHEGGGQHVEALSIPFPLRQQVRRCETDWNETSTLRTSSTNAANQAKNMTKSIVG